MTKPVQDAARDVTGGETITLTIPKVAVEVLANGDGMKIAELSDARLLLRAALGEADGNG